MMRGLKSSRYVCPALVKGEPIDVKTAVIIFGGY